MASYSQLPGTLNLSVKSGDDFATTVDFDVNLTGYTTSVSLISLVTGSEITPISSTVTNAAMGQVTINLTDVQTSALSPGSYRWGMKWTASNGDVRSALGGILEVIR
jgi:hypothetical protein